VSAAEPYPPGPPGTATGVGGIILGIIGTLASLGATWHETTRDGCHRLRLTSQVTHHC
jgi:hypothetical protein